MRPVRSRRARAALALAAALAVAGCATSRPPRPLPPLTPAQRDRLLTRAEAGAELDSLLALVEEVHPAPYTVASRDSVRRLRDALVTALPPRADRPTFAVTAQRLLAALGDGHTMLQPPSEELAAELARGGRTLPFAVVRVGDGWHVAASVDTALRAGDRLRRLNGHDVDSLARALGTEIPAELEAWRTARLAGSFAVRAWTHGVRAPYDVEIERDGAPLRVALAGATRAQLDAAAAARGAPASSAGLAYRALPGRVAYLDFTTMTAPADRFAAALDDVMARAAADSARGIVVDLRRNGGGNSARGDALLARLTDRPYTAGLRKEWKMSRRYRAYLASQASPWVRWLPFPLLGRRGAQLYGGPDGKLVTTTMTDSIRPRARVVRPLCVLIGPGTFSSAMLLANSVKQARLGTLVGAPTGEPPNSFGEVYAFRLPLTGLAGQVSSAAFVLDPDPAARARGVLPDVPVAPTPDDVRAGRDPALERARACAAGAR